MIKKLQNITTNAALTLSRITSTAARATAIVAASLMCGWLATEAYATASTKEASTAMVDSVEVQVLFPLGKSSIDLSFQQNGTKLADFIERIQSANANTAITPPHTHAYLRKRLFLARRQLQV